MKSDDIILGTSARPTGVLPYLNEEEVSDACELINSSKEDRIQFIYDLKASFRWMDGKTHKDLAKCWDMSIAAVRGFATAADRHFRMNLGNPDEIHGKLLAQLENVTSSAMNATKGVVVQTSRDTSEVEMVPAPDHKAAIAGIKEIAALTGLSRKKLDVNVDYTGVPFDDMMEEMKKQLEEEKKRLEATTPEALLTEGQEVDD